MLVHVACYLGEGLDDEFGVLLLLLDLAVHLRVCWLHGVWNRRGHEGLGPFDDCSDAVKPEGLRIGTQLTVSSVRGASS